MSTPRNVRHAAPEEALCAICNEPVKLETAKTDGDGHTVPAEGESNVSSPKVALTIRPND
jgi:hypothetical protein